MAKAPMKNGAYTTWTVHSHGPLTPFAEGVWYFDGSVPDMQLERRCTVVRLADGSLLIHNGVAADEETMAKLDALGPVRWLLVPNGYHRLDALVWKQRCPEAKVLCPRGARARVEQVVPVDGSYDDLPEDPEVKLFHLEGVARAEGVVEIRRADGATLIFNDALFNLRKMSGLFGFVYGTLLGNAGRPKVTLIFRRFVMKDRKALKAHLERLSQTPGLQRILMSHGAPIPERGAEVLAEVASAL